MYLIALLFLLTVNQAPEQTNPSIKKEAVTQTTVEAESKSHTEKQDSYNPKDDSLYRVYLVATIVGVILALGGLLVLTHQINVAKANIDAVINAERSWVMADVEQEKVQIFVTDSMSAGAPKGTHSGIPSIVVTFKNVGRIPCWITEKKIQFALVEKLPPEPTFDDNAVIDDFPEPVVVGQPLKVEWQHLHAPGEQVVTLSAVPTKTPFAGSNYPIVFGVIKYRDVFSNNRETRFGYQIRPHGSLRRIKSDRYNTNT